MQIVTIQEMLEEKKRLDVRLTVEVLKSAEKQRETRGVQVEIDFENQI